MTLDVKLEAGFFKTWRYYLTVSHRQIILTPHESENVEFVIDYNDLISICILKKGSQTGEVEIISQSRVYIVLFTIQANFDDVCHTFAKEFGSLVTF
ncbi:MAG: hypothetical protein PHD36_03475 [Desulfotomaculaceae bacterium]|nr:hypothetical protein [Desulfotomaculaceae bacterium]